MTEAIEKACKKVIDSGLWPVGWGGDEILKQVKEKFDWQEVEPKPICPFENIQVRNVSEQRESMLA